MTDMSVTETADESDDSQHNAEDRDHRKGDRNPEIEKSQMRRLYSMEMGVGMVGRSDKNLKEMQRSTCGTEWSSECQN